jgi:hypothetical protein
LAKGGDQIPLRSSDVEGTDFESVICGFSVVMLISEDHGPIKSCKRSYLRAWLQSRAKQFLDHLLLKISLTTALHFSRVQNTTPTAYTEMEGSTLSACLTDFCAPNSY